MITIKRTDSTHTDFIELVKHLDTDLAIRNGENNDFFAQFNKVDTIKHVVIAYDGQTPVGCGAIKAYDNEAMEVKRMFVFPEQRGKGIATKVLTELEIWTAELSFKKCVLETGLKQPEAIGLYKKNNYQQIPNYGQYADVEDSVCFEKYVS